MKERRMISQDSQYGDNKIIIGSVPIRYDKEQDDFVFDLSKSHEAPIYGFNLAVGMEALYKCTTGHHNVALGAKSGYDITTGSYNIGVGPFTLKGVTDEDGVIDIGGKIIQDMPTAIELHEMFQVALAKPLIEYVTHSNDWMDEEIIKQALTFCINEFPTNREYQQIYDKIINRVKNDFPR